jgi:hypothetical protein
MKDQPPFSFSLLPGDILLYRPASAFGWLIAFKTWNRISHVETYVGDGKSAASRDGKGVNVYPLRTAQLQMVRRPKIPFNIRRAMAWQSCVNGQGYDWKGLLVFALAVQEGSRDRMFCSEHATRFARRGGITPFAPAYDADRVAPATFLTSAAYDTVWEYPDGTVRTIDPELAAGIVRSQYGMAFS